MSRSSFMMRVLEGVAFAAVLIVLPSAAVAQQVYFGNLHAHTKYSDGSGIPSEMYAYARDVGDLDFLAITEHNHPRAEIGASRDRRDGILIASQPELYDGPQAASLIQAAGAANRDGTFVALYGQEFSSIASGNHVNVFDAPHVITAPNGNYKKLIEWIEANPDTMGASPLLQFNHPALGSSPAAKEYGRDEFNNSIAQWVASIGPHVSLIERNCSPQFGAVRGWNFPVAVGRGI